MTTPAGRLLHLLSLLQTRRDWPGTVLAERLEVSDRTVRRDVDRLRAMGYTVHATMGPDGGYRLDAGTALPPLLFDDEQVVALAVALQAAAGTGLDIGVAALQALTTVRQVLPARLRQRLDAVRFTTAYARTGGPSPDVLLALSQATRGREVVRFDYGSGGADGPPRRVEPHHLVTSHGRWYLVAWDLDRADWRIFRADRLTPRTPTGPGFAPREVPGGDVALYLEARFRGSERDDEWPCVGTVTLGRPAREVAPFADQGVVTDLGPGRCRLRAGSWSWVALAGWFTQFDTDVEVVGPPELVRAFATLAARTAASTGA